MNDPIMSKVRKAIGYADNGDPAKDAIDDDEILDALRLLVEVVDGDWIPVERSKPEWSRMVILATPTSHRGDVDYGFLDGADGKFKVQTMMGWEPVENFGGMVTHWRPMPKAP